MSNSLETVRGLGSTYNAANHFIDKHLSTDKSQKAAIIYGDQQTTYEELSTQVNKFGNALKNIDIERENRILMVAYDSPEFAISFFGTLKIGAVPVPVNTMMQPKDYEYFLNHSRAKALVIEENIWKMIKPYKENFLFLKKVIVISANGSTDTDVIDYHHFKENASSILESAYAETDDVAFWLYSSGSTGQPKGVVHHQRSMEAACENYAENVLKIGPEDITFSASKLFFAYGLGNGLYFPFKAGATTILMQEKPTPEKVFQIIEEQKPTVFFGVPSLYGAMITYAEENGKQLDLSSIRVCVSAGESLPSHFLKKWKELFGLDILDGIGSTEALHIFLSNRLNDIQPGSTGKTVLGYEAKVVDEKGNNLPKNEIGDLVIRGESISSGYWANLRETNNKFIGEWMYTGDKYYQDDDGYFWYCGRSDDMLKVGGIWVSPIEIESALLQHDWVSEIAVVGRKNEDGLTYPKAYIVPGNITLEDAELVKQQLKLHVKQQLAPYKYPREIEFLDTLPKTATGKVQRFQLKTL